MSKLGVALAFLDVANASSLRVRLGNLCLPQKQLPRAEDGEVEGALEIGDSVRVGVAGDVADGDWADGALAEKSAATTCTIR